MFERHIDPDPVLQSIAPDLPEGRVSTHPAFGRGSRHEQSVPDKGLPLIRKQDVIESYPPFVPHQGSRVARI